MYCGIKSAFHTNFRYAVLGSLDSYDCVFFIQLSLLSPAAYCQMPVRVIHVKMCKRKWIIYNTSDITDAFHLYLIACLLKISTKRINFISCRQIISFHLYFFLLLSQWTGWVNDVALWPVIKGQKVFSYMEYNIIVSDWLINVLFLVSHRSWGYYSSGNKACGSRC